MATNSILVEYRSTIWVRIACKLLYTQNKAFVIVAIAIVRIFPLVKMVKK